MKTLIACGAAALLLVACGGGGGYDGPAPAPAPAAAAAPADPGGQVPPSASESAAALVGYLNALAGADAEAQEPVSVDGFEPKAPDDNEPDALS